jgi:hypothetical protein
MNMHILGPILKEIIYRGLAPLYYGVLVGLGLWLLARLLEGFGEIAPKDCELSMH